MAPQHRKEMCTGPSSTKVDGVHCWAGAPHTRHTPVEAQVNMGQNIAKEIDVGVQGYLRANFRELFSLEML